MSRGRGKGVDIRKATSETNWYPIVGFVALSAVGAIGLIAVVYSYGYSDGIVYPVVAYIMIMSFVSVVSHASLFKDSAYIRGSIGTWKPKWWYYTVGPIASPFVIYVVGNSVTQTMAAIGFAAMGYFALTFGAHSYYLYRRHEKVGVP